jgi:putative transposase
VRRIIYTTNAIEVLNAKLRRAVRARGHFPTDEAATKLLFLVLRNAAEEWKMPPRE